MTEKLKDLNYEYNSLEPFFDEQTMKIHHQKHHKGYVDKLNEAIKNTKIENKPLTEILKNIEIIPKEIKQKVINFGGGVYNHNFFWAILKKDSPFNKESEIGKAIIEKFESLDKFKEEFKQKALTLFGSGWTWLVLNSDNELEIIQTKDQNSVISKNQKPILTLDVWEHAYYLKYKNKRDEFIDAFFNVINWEKINDLFIKSKK